MELNFFFFLLFTNLKNDIYIIIIYWTACFTSRNCRCYACFLELIHRYKKPTIDADSERPNWEFFFKAKYSLWFAIVIEKWPQHCICLKYIHNRSAVAAYESKKHLEIISWKDTGGTRLSNVTTNHVTEREWKNNGAESDNAPQFSIYARSCQI